MNAKVAQLVCKEYKISCAELILREDITVDQFIDVVEGNRTYIPVLYVFNKIDAITIEELDILDQMPVSKYLRYYEYVLKNKLKKNPSSFSLAPVSCYFLF